MNTTLQWKRKKGKAERKVHGIMQNSTRAMPKPNHLTAMPTTNTMPTPTSHRRTWKEGTTKQASSSDCDVLCVYFRFGCNGTLYYKIKMCMYISLQTAGICTIWCKVSHTTLFMGWARQHTGLSNTYASYAQHRVSFLCTWKIKVWWQTLVKKYILN